MNKLESLIENVFDYKQVETGAEIVFKDLETWDSLTHMNFIITLEQEFNVDLTSDEIVEMQTYSSTKLILESKGVNLQ